VDQLVGRLRSGWVRGYIAAKRRGQLGRKIPKENSLFAYVTWIKRAGDLGLPDLAACSLEELCIFLEAWKRGHGEYFNFNLIGVIKEALGYLKRLEQTRHGRSLLTPEHERSRKPRPHPSRVETSRRGPQTTGPDSTVHRMRSGKRSSGSLLRQMWRSPTESATRGRQDPPPGN